MDLRSPPRAVATRRPARLDADAVIACAPLLVVLAVGTLRKGGFFTPDVVVLPCLALALAVASPVALTWLRAHPLPALAGVAATAWWIVDASASGRGVESWRLAATGVCAAAGYGVARGLPSAARRISAWAITWAGVSLSVAGFAVVAARSTTWTWADERSLRFQGPLTYPSAIGLYLVLSLLASLAVWRRDNSRAARIAAPARALIVLGVACTDSRGALAALVVALCFRRVRRELWPALLAAALVSPVLLYGQRDGVRPWLIVATVAIGVLAACATSAASASRVRFRLSWRWLAGLPIVAGLVAALVAAGWLLATQHRAVSGFDASWTERGHILRGALDLFGSHPWFGAGPDPLIPTTTLAGLPGVDAFAHNEPLEILVSLGIVGAAGLAVAALIVVRALWASRGELAAPALAAFVAGGLVDFVWHFPALGLLAGAVAGLAASRAKVAPPT